MRENTATHAGAVYRSTIAIAAPLNWMEIWSGGQIAVEAVTFSTAHQLLGATENWQKAFDAWLETSGRGKDSL